VLKPLLSVIVKMYPNIEISMSVGTAKAISSSASGGKQDNKACPVLYVFVFSSLAAAELMNEKMALPQTRLVGFLKQLHEKTRHSQKGQRPLDLNRSF
jgi:hypothetical protein